MCGGGSHKSECVLMFQRNQFRCSIWKRTYYPLVKGRIRYVGMATTTPYSKETHLQTILLYDERDAKAQLIYLIKKVVK